jgi:quercetin dioxygenase-like cupin family protein
VRSGLPQLFLLAALVLPLPANAQADTAKSVLENDRVRVTEQTLNKGGKLPTNNKYDVLTVQLADGETTYVDPGKLGKVQNTPLGDSHYFVTGSKRSIIGQGKEPVRFIQVQFLRSPGKYVPLEVPPTHYCNPGSKKACITEQYLFCTDRFCVETVTLEPGAISTQHTHDADHMVIPTSNFRWRDEAVGQPPEDQDFKLGTARYFQAGVTHRLINVGATTATMVVVQFK